MRESPPGSLCKQQGWAGEERWQRGKRRHLSATCGLGPNPSSLTALSLACRAHITGGREHELRAARLRPQPVLC